MRSSKVREFVRAFVRIAYLSAVAFSDLLNQGFRETGLSGPLLALCFLSSACAQVAQIGWDVQQDRPVPHDVLIWRGETVDLLPRLVQGTAPVAVTNAPVEFRYREAALTNNTYRTVTATANTNSGVLAIRWLPDYDAGAAWYDYQIIVGSNAANPRCFGRITMRGTLGHPAPGAPPPPVTLYPTRADLQSASNALAGAVQALGGTVSGIGSNVVDLAAAVAAIPPPSTDALRLIATNGIEWIDGEGGRWRVTVSVQTNVTCTLSAVFGVMTGPESYNRPSQNCYTSAPNTIIYDDEWQMNFNQNSDGSWSVYNSSSHANWSAFNTELPLVAEPFDPAHYGTATFDWLINVEAVTSRWGTVANVSDIPSVGGLAPTNAPALQDPALNGLVNGYVYVPILVGPTNQLPLVANRTNGVLYVEIP